MRRQQQTVTHLVGGEEEAFEAAAQGALRADDINKGRGVRRRKPRLRRALIGRMPDIKDPRASLLPQPQLQAVGIFREADLRR